MDVYRDGKWISLDKFELSKSIEIVKKNLELNIDAMRVRINDVLMYLARWNEQFNKYLDYLKERVEKEGL